MQLLMLLNGISSSMVLAGAKLRTVTYALVYGFDKTTSWGMATFVSQAQHNNCRLKFGPLEGNSGAYTWLEISGITDTRAGPDSYESDELRNGSDPPASDFQFDNKCLFVRTLNILVTLTDDAWVDIHSTLDSVHVDPRHDGGHCFQSSSIEQYFYEGWFQVFTLSRSAIRNSES